MLVLSRQKDETIIIGGGKKKGVILLELSDAQRSLLSRLYQVMGDFNPQKQPTEADLNRFKQFVAGLDLATYRIWVEIFATINRHLAKGSLIEVTVVDIRGDKVRLGVNAPKNISIHRKEVQDEIDGDDNGGDHRQAA